MGGFFSAPGSVHIVLHFGGLFGHQVFQVVTVAGELDVLYPGRADVPAHTHHAQRPSLGIAHHVGTGFQVANASVGLQHPELGVKALFARNGLL